MKKAIIVEFNFATRIVIDESNENLAEVLKLSKPKILEKVKNELGENLQEWYDDEEVEFGVLKSDVNLDSDYNISELGECSQFISGTYKWKLDWADCQGERFKPKDIVEFEDEDDGQIFQGEIEYIIVTETGSVEVSIKDTALGRVDLRELKMIEVYKPI